MPRAGWFRVQEFAPSRASGVVLILSGLAVAAYGMPSGVGSSAPQSALRADIGASPVVAQRAREDEAGNEPHGAIVPPPPRARQTPRAFTAPVVVTIAPHPGEPEAMTPPRIAAIPKDRDALARELQKELRRVGCYAGGLNGIWTPSTRRAMKAFTDRLNAILPVEEPDAVLLVLVQSQQDRVCGKPCPAGRGLSEYGRCLPDAILARATRSTAPASVLAQVPSSAPLPTARRATAIGSWSTSVTAAAPASLPPKVAAATAIGPVSGVGRMGLAGPAEEPRPAAAGNTPAAAKAPVRRRAAIRAKRPRAGPPVVPAPHRGVFVRTVFSLVGSSL